MEKKKKSGASEWIDPDDAPEITEEMLDRADWYHGDKLVRRGRPPLAAPKQAIKLQARRRRGGAFPRDRPRLARLSIKRRAAPRRGNSKRRDSDERRSQVRSPARRTPVTSDSASVRRRRIAAKTIRLRDKEHCEFVRTEPYTSCAAARRPRPITFGLLSPVLSAERSAMNTQSQSAGCTIGICTVTAMKPHGGPGSASIPCRSRSNFGGDRD